MAQKDLAITAANQVCGMCQLLKGLRATVNELVQNYNSEGWNSFWNAFATAVQSADGSLGAADGAPNAAHPIDPRVTGQTGVNKAVSATQLAAGITLAQQLQKLFTNQAVTQGNYNQTIDDLGS